jgi:hypothetical protein
MGVMVGELCRGGDPWRWRLCRAMGVASYHGIGETVELERSPLETP